MGEEGAGGPHPEMAMEAEAEVPTDPGPIEGAPKSLTETYDDELRLNLEAHRSLRKSAFWTVGITSGVYLVALLYTLLAFFHRGWLAKIIEVEELNSYVLVLIGVVLTLFAAVPLTLIMGLVKMISEKSDSDAGAGIKLPNGEMAKLLFDAASLKK